MPLQAAPSKWFRSLRARLTIWHTLVVLLAVVLALLMVREGLRFYLLLETDIVLNDEARELVLAVERWYPNQAQIIAEMEQKAEGHAGRGWHVRWLSPDRKQTIWASEFAPQQPLSRVTSSPPGYVVWESRAFRSVERRIDVPNIPAYYIRVGTPTKFVNDDISRLTRIAGPVALAILLLAPLGGYFLSERAVQPLQDIIRTTARLRPTHLKERLQPRGVGDELDQLAVKINQFLDQIAAHVQRNRDFVANAAHELRSPLTAILSSVDVAIQKQRSPEEYEELLYAIEHECRHLAQLVNQLLQLTESEDGTLEFQCQPVSIADIIAHAVEMFEPVAEENGVKLSAELLDESLVAGDRQQLRQLITNLIDNSIKFTPQGGSVRISAVRDDTQRQLVITLADTGIGIPKDDLPRIFERFYQVDRARSRNSAHRGNGLGLPICLAIVHRHEGTIDVASDHGKGTTIVIRLPLMGGKPQASAGH